MSREAEPNAILPEEYMLRDTAFQRMMSERSATHQAGFLLPHLRPDMTLLDCGSGPGSITCELATIVAPGMVTGIDSDADEVERAKILATELQVANVQFQLENVYELPFDSETFDAVFSNALLGHLSKPIDAIQEMKRVLKPGGVIGIRTADRDGYIFAPANSSLEKTFEWVEQVKERQGVSVRIGKNLRGVFHSIGLVRTVASASYDFYGSTKRTQMLARNIAAALSGGRNVEQLLEIGLADRAEVEATAAALLEWGNSPEAFFAQSYCEAVGWKPD